MLDKLEYLVLNNAVDIAMAYSNEIFNVCSSNPRYLCLKGNIFVAQGNIENGKKYFI